MRYSATGTAKTTSFTFNTRYPVTRAWRVNPRLRVDFRENENDGSDQWTAAPSLRLHYRWRRRYQLELEPEWCGRLHYQVRMYPYHRLLTHALETGLMVWL